MLLKSLIMKQRQSLKEEKKQSDKFTVRVRTTRELLNKLPPTESNYNRLTRIERILKNGYKERKSTN